MADWSPIDNQPLNVFFDLTIGGISKIYQNPDMPIRFEYFNSGDQNTVTIQLFDETGFWVEPALWSSAQTGIGGAPGGYFQFGYQGKNPHKSQVYQFSAASIKPVKQDNSYVITIVGSLCQSIHTSANSINGTLKECLMQFAKIHNLQLNVVPEFEPHYMRDGGVTDSDSTALSERIFNKWMNESDWSFINRIIKWGRDANDNAGYKVSITSVNSTQMLNVSRTQTGSIAPDLKFVVEAPDTTVISWSPDIDLLSAITGANANHQNSYQPSSGQEQKFVTDPALTQQLQAPLPGQMFLPVISPLPAQSQQPDSGYYADATQMPAAVTGAAIRARPGSTSSGYAGRSKFQTDQLNSTLAGMSATLVILGDPTIDPNDPSNFQVQYVEVTDYYPVNYITGSTAQQLHYSSGIYRIESVHHVISSEGYQTTLELTRMSMPQPDDSTQPTPAEKSS